MSRGPDEVHRRALVADLHLDTPTASLMDPAFRLSERRTRGHVDLPRLRDGGVDAAFFVAWVEPYWMDRPGESFHRAETLLRETRRQVEETHGMRVAETAAEVEEAREAGEVAVLLAVEGGHAMESSLDRLRDLREMGVRYLTLTWNHATEWADACCSPARHGGLTDFGRRVIGTMEELGILPDLSHASDATVRDVLEVAERPVLVSHSCARSLVDHPRNIPDELAERVAEGGGVIGVNFFPGFADPGFADGIRTAAGTADGPATDLDAPLEETAFLEMRERWSSLQASLPRPPLSCVLKQMEHLVAVVGAEHVALGSDFDGVSILPEGLDHVGHLPRITRGLLERGMGEAGVEKILGRNVMRLLA